jgi:N utilization substance protein B
MKFINPDKSTFLEYYNANEFSLSDRRCLVLHLLYAMEMNDYEMSLAEVIYYYNIDFFIIIEPEDPIVNLVESIIKKNNEIDLELKNFLENWQISRISVLVKLILRYGIFELQEQKNDSKLIIYEAVELAKGYAEENSYRIINGVLDSYSKKYKIK